MLEKIKNSAKYVSENSSYVKINYSKIDQIINDFDANFSFWAETNPFGVMDLNEEEIIYFLLVIHTIGDYCFWGKQKWKIETPFGELDGYYAFVYLVSKRIKEHKDFNMSYQEFEDYIKPTNLPLVKERYQNLTIMNKYLKNHNFYQEIKDLTSDIALFSYIISNFPYFKDETTYKGQKIYFYKRAQLFTSDILHIRKIKEKIDVNYQNLRGCADYKLPQVLNSFGILEYTHDLDEMINNEEEVIEGSEMEIEIRANTLEVIRYISEKLNIPCMDINDYIWLLSQNKSMINKKYHHTLTMHY